VIPAFLLAVVLLIYVWWTTRKRDDLRGTPTRGRELAKSGVKAIPIFVTPVIVLGGILGGVFTPTEAAAAAVMWILVLGVIYRSLTVRALGDTLLRTTRTTAQIMIIVAAASVFSFVVSRERGPALLADAMLGVTENQVVFLLMLIVFLVLVGMLLEPVAAILLTAPVVLPVAEEFGVDPLHMGVIMILALVIGLLTPPIGLVLYVLTSVTDLSFGTIARGTLPFLVPLFVALLLVTFVPDLSLALPRALGL